jgi:Flp pilus assembly protein CpaB
VGQVTQVAVQAGEQITPAKVTSTGTAVSQFGSKTPLSLVIPAGMRAVAVVVSDVASAGGLVRAGDYVDLMLNQQNGDGQSSACYVLQDVQVIAVGTTLAAPDAGSSASVLSNQATTSGAVTVTVAVNPGDASILAAAQQSPSNGSVGTNLWMTLRPFGEHGVNTGLASCGIPSAASS